MSGRGNSPLRKNQHAVRRFSPDGVFTFAGEGEISLNLISRCLILELTMPVIFKYLITSALVVLISEVAKRSDRLGALIAALPLVTVLAMTWMFIELKGEAQTEKIANHAYYTFWYVIPTLPMFLLIPWMLRRGLHYGWSLLAGSLLTAVLFVLIAWVMKRFGVELM